MNYLSILKDISQQYTVYIVGGFIRDYLMGNEVNDIDLLVMSDMKSIVEEFSKNINKKKIVLDEVRGVYRVVPEENICVDFSNPVGQDLLQDLGRRDFTCNSIAVKLTDLSQKNNEYRLKKENMIDPFGGIDDIENKVLKMVNSNFIERDPIRILRAYRFSNNLDFNIETKTFEIINDNLKLIKSIKNERIKEELIKLLDNKLKKKVLNKFLKSKLMRYLFNINTYEKNSQRKILLKQNDYIFNKQILQNCKIKKYHFNLLQLFLLPVIKNEVSIDEVEKIFLNYTFSKKDVKILKDHLWSCKMILKNMVLYKKQDQLIYQDLFVKNIYPGDIKFLLLSYFESTEINEGIKEKLIYIVEKLKLMKKRTTPKVIDGEKIKEILDLKESKIIGDILEIIRRKRALGLLKGKAEVYNYLENTFNKNNKS
ncbi:MAG: hypothetical protein K9K76_00200 [Halanaerobiales bacterium]|nr:hypothetical protein [Halanaerobiales bacterium]